MPKVIPEYREAAKTKIIKAAQTVFAKQGYHDSTMDDIAKEVGVSKGALYSYFSSKEDLLKEISLQGHRTLKKLCSPSWGKTAVLEGALEQIYKMITVKYEGSLHTHFEIIALASHDTKVRKILIEDYREDIDAIEAFIKKKTNQGAIRTDLDAQVTAELFTSFYIGTLARLVMGFPNKEIHELLDKIYAAYIGD